jgi:hypothetical protein
MANGNGSQQLLNRGTVGTGGSAKWENDDELLNRGTPNTGSGGNLDDSLTLLNRGATGGLSKLKSGEYSRNRKIDDTAIYATIP